MKILVTGGAGFIGSHLVDAYVARGHEVVVVDNLSSGRRRWLNPAATFHRVDIRSRRLAAVFAAERPDAVSHQAAQVSVRRSVATPSLDARINILGTLNLLTCCRRAGVRRVICASTGGAIYGDTTVIPTPEHHRACPASPYGISKLAMEHYLRHWSEGSGISALALRYANVYGPRQNPLGEAGVVAIFTHRLLRAEPVTINGDGRQTRDYVYVEDVVEANLLALERPEVTGVLNVGTGLETSVVELLERLQQVAAVEGTARHGPPRPGEQRRSALDASRARTLLGWRARIGLDDGLGLTVRYLRPTDSSG